MRADGVWQIDTTLMVSEEGNVAKKPGEVSTGRAASRLGVDIQTVRRWCRAANGGGRSRIRYARKDVGGHWWLSRDEVEDIRERSTS